MSKESDIAGAFINWKNKLFELGNKTFQEVEAALKDSKAEPSIEKRSLALKATSHHAELAKHYILNLWEKKSKEPVNDLVTDKLFEKVNRLDIESIYNTSGDILTPEVLEKLTTLSLMEFSNKKRRLLENFEHTQKTNADKNKKKKNKDKGEKNNSLPPEHKESKLKESDANQKSRAIVLEKIGTAINFRGELNDENFLKEIRKSGSPISEKDILVLIGYLQTTPKRDVLSKYGKRVLNGPFKDYRVVGKGKLGRLLFKIDDKDMLHIRVGSHDAIYGFLTKVS